MALSSQRAARIRKRSRTSAAGLVQRCRAERAGRGARGAGSGVCHQHPRRGLRPRAARSPGLPSRSRPQAAPRPALPGVPRSSSSRGRAHPAPPLPTETQPSLGGSLSVSFFPVDSAFRCGRPAPSRTRPRWLRDHRSRAPSPGILAAGTAGRARLPQAASAPGHVQAFASPPWLPVQVKIRRRCGGH